MSDPGRKGSDEYIPSSNGAPEASLEQNKPAPSDLELLAKLEEANRYVLDITVISQGLNVRKPVFRFLT